MEGISVLGPRRRIRREMSYPRSIRVVEVGPRDGLQNEAATVSLATKVNLIESLANSGLKAIECGSFVSAKWVPQMADTGEVLKRIRRNADVSYSVLVPNFKGLRAAIDAHAGGVAVFTAASESFSQRNINCSIEESLRRVRPVIETALTRNMIVRGYVSCVLGCPYEGEVPLSNVARVSQQLFEMGCSEISLGDTIGTGTPLKSQQMIKAVSVHVPVDRLAVHFHDTWGQALANILACLQLGVSVIDSSVAGLGGCPYAAGATGNIATEDVVYMLNGMGIETGIQLEKLVEAGWMISTTLGRKPASRVAIAMRRN